MQLLLLNIWKSINIVLISSLPQVGIKDITKEFHNYDDKTSVIFLIDCFINSIVSSLIMKPLKYLNNVEKEEMEKRNKKLNKSLLNEPSSENYPRKSNSSY